MRRFRLKCPGWLYRWIDRRGRIPWLVRKLWPTAHWCPEMDELLVVENIDDCFCNHCDDAKKRYWKEFSAAVRRRSLRTNELPF